MRARLPRPILALPVLALLALGAMFAACAGVTRAAQAEAPGASISAAFTPERLGAPTTVMLGFAIAAPAGQIPPPLTGLDVRYPEDLGIATSELGTASCQVAPLEAHGPSACPPNSRMGSGSALVEIPVGEGVQEETASIALLAGPSEGGYFKLLAAATGLSPVIARIVMPSLLKPGDLDFTVPLVPSLPGAPYVSVVRVRISLGGRLTYYERRHGKLIAYHPRSVTLPRSCPRGGFRFYAVFSFLNGATTQAATTVACPRAR